MSTTLTCPVEIDPWKLTGSVLFRWDVMNVSKRNPFPPAAESAVVNEWLTQFGADRVRADRADLH